MFNARYLTEINTWIINKSDRNFGKWQRNSVNGCQPLRYSSTLLGVGFFFFQEQFITEIVISGKSSPSFRNDSMQWKSIKKHGSISNGMRINMLENRLWRHFSSIMTADATALFITAIHSHCVRFESITNHFLIGS